MTTEHTRRAEAIKGFMDAIGVELTNVKAIHIKAPTITITKALGNNDEADFRLAFEFPKPQPAPEEPISEAEPTE